MLKKLIDASKLDNKHAPTTIPDNYKLDTINTPLSQTPNQRNENLINRPPTEYIYTHHLIFTW